MVFSRFLSISVCLLALSAVSAPVWAQGRATSLAVTPEIQETGLIKFILPRFSLKHGVRVTVLEDTAGASGVLIEGGDRPAFSRGGVNFGITILATDDPHFATLSDWLTSEIGQRTVLSYKLDGEAVFEVPVMAAVVEEADVPDGDAARGADLALTACGRCHVVGDVNRMKGIGSTPSFAVLRSLDDWMERFTAFYALNPHPSFTVIPDLTEPFDETRPSPITPVTLTLEELENIVAYAATVDPADLGAPIAHQ